MTGGPLAYSGADLISLRGKMDLWVPQTSSSDMLDCGPWSLSMNTKLNVEALFHRAHKGTESDSKKSTESDSKKSTESDSKNEETMMFMSFDS